MTLNQCIDQIEKELSVIGADNFSFLDRQGDGRKNFLFSISTFGATADQVNEIVKRIATDGGFPVIGEIETTKLPARELTHGAVIIG